MARKYQVSQFLGVKSETGEAECPLGSGIVFKVKADNDPAFLRWLREQDDPMTAIATKASIAMAVAEKEGTVPADVAELEFSERLLHYASADIGAVALAEIDRIKLSAKAARLLVGWSGVLDDAEKDVPFNQKEAVEFLGQPHAPKIAEGEFDGKYADDVWRAVIFDKARAMSEAQAQSLEEQAKNSKPS